MAAPDRGRIVITLACIVAACLGFGVGVLAAAILHESSWGRGHRAGYSDGRQDGQDDGYGLGVEDGHRAGVEEGRQLQAQDATRTVQARHAQADDAAAWNDVQAALDPPSPDATTVLHRSDETGVINLPPLVPFPIVPESIVPTPIVPTQRRRPE